MNEFPFFRASGTLRESAVALGEHWRENLQYMAERITGGARPWWKRPEYADLIQSTAPHLPDLFVGMAQGAGIAEDAVGSQLIDAERGGCTSFAVRGAMTRDGRVLAGQNKDGPLARRSRFEVVAFEPADAPSFLTLTYPGWLFGQGFVAGGCAIYRNQLYAGFIPGLPYAEWGLLALHCTSVEQVEELSCKYGMSEEAHVTVVDTHDGMIGIESTRYGIHILRPTNAVYTHANAVCGDPIAIPNDPGDEIYTREDSLRRERRLHELLENRTDWTCAELFKALGDHQNGPRSICRHQEPDVAVTAAAVVSDASRGELWVAAGSPCDTPPICYRLNDEGTPTRDRATHE